MKFKIVNGKVFDPTQNLNGNKIDIYVDNGIIVKPNPSEFYKFKTIYDATDLIVMAGAIDIHSHIAGGNVNNARLLSPEIHSNFLKPLNKFYKGDTIYMKMYTIYLPRES